MRTRRDFIGRCSVIGLTASLGPTAWAAPRKPRPVELDDVALNAFSAQVNSAFVVRTSSGALISLSLVAVETPPRRGGLDAANEKFTLVFAGAPDQPLEQNTYSFENSALGIFPLFIARVGSRDASRCYYEAVFNRPAESVRRRGRGKSRER